MSEPHEPSYYEIALTNRQVVVAFVILLTCLLAAFVSGVWIGRESTARATQEAMVRATPPAPQEGKSLEELDFFDSRGKKGKGGKHQEATSGGTLVDDMSGKKTTAPAPAAPVHEEPAPAAPERSQAAQEAAAPAPVLPDPAEERRNRRKARNAAAEEAAGSPAPAPATPEPAPTPAKTPKAAKNAAATPAIPKGAYVIQVFSSPDQTQAERIRGRLVSGGQKAYLSPIDRGGRTMYRVRIGPFKTRADAQGVADKVRKGYKLDTWVTE
ncbi:MAG TPA: SPOR domain-containing protein [Thermoanaerobaculia bacterium]